MSLKITRSDGLFLQFDTATAIANDPSITVSSHPLEDKTEVTDHVQRGPDTYSVTAILSRSPLGGTPGYRRPCHFWQDAWAICCPYRSRK